MKRRWIAWGLAAAVVAVGVAVGAVSLRGPLVDAVVVQSAPLVRTLQFSARVATLSRVDVGSTLTGRVALRSSKLQIPASCGAARFSARPVT